MLPYHCKINESLIFLRLNERGELCLNKCAAQREWQPEEVLCQECRRFAAAPDADGCLHIVAVNGENQLSYFLIKEGLVRKLPFIIKESSAHCLLSFSGGGGQYLGNDSSGRLVAAKFSTASGWREEKPAFAENHSTPVCLLTDKGGALHLITYSVADGSLIYRCRLPGQKWTEPFPLGRALQMSPPPSLWVDLNLNLHVAWYVSRNHTICYRLKKTGGWPHGGWLPEHSLQVNTAARLLSFHEQPESIKIWCVGDGGIVHIFSQQNANWVSTEHETSFRLPIRQGRPGREWYNLAESLPASGLFFPVMPEQVDTAAEQQEEQEQKLLGQLMHLMEEKKSLKAVLNKKDEALTQYRLMLERSQETHKKQSSEWEVTVKGLEVKLSQLEQELRRREAEITSYREQVERTQKQFSARETERKTDQAEILALREKIIQYQQQDDLLKTAIRKLEQELTGRRGVWETISSVFHKKE